MTAAEATSDFAQEDQLAEPSCGERHETERRGSRSGGNSSSFWSIGVVFNEMWLPVILGELFPYVCL